MLKIGHNYSQSILINARAQDRKHPQVQSAQVITMIGAYMSTTQRSWQLCLLFSLLLLVKSGYALESLADDDMRETTGQSLFTASYINGTGTTATGSAGVDFYRLGLDAEMSLNMNIKSLKLGCGGINGAGCDIDMSDVSLTGSDTCAGGRPNCDAVVTRPFLEFAIKNPNSLATREILGFRFGAQSLSGLLTAGTNDGTANGINAFSGYMQIAASTGTTNTKADNFTNTLKGKANIGGCILGCPAPFTTKNEPLAIPSLGVNFTSSALTVEGNRLTSATISAFSNLPSIPITDPGSGFRSATMDGCFVLLIVPLCGYSIKQIYMIAQLTGLKADITINENLGYIHRVPLNNPFGLSVQKEDVLWPAAPAVARRGWYLAVNDPIQLGDLSTPATYNVDISPTFPQVATQINAFLAANPISIPFGDALGTVFNVPLHVNIGNINLASQPALTLALTNLPLGTAQDVVPNCFGTLKFC